MALSADRGGEGAPLLVLLHGLSATREVWASMIPHVEAAWPGRWLAPDLPGHGRSEAIADYAPTVQAAHVADLVRGEGADGEVVVVGHSMGGVVALTLAGGAHGLRPARVFGLGVKVAWTAAELEAMSARAAAPAKVFATRAEAIDRYLKVSGLAGLAAADSATAEAGVARTVGGWRLAADPRTHGVGAPDMPALTAAASAPVHLASGGVDAMCALADLRRWDPDARALPGLGHNAMIEAPKVVWAWIAERVGSYVA
jgi:pimeloyl-ACP methyl ester carboxylesterase